MKIILLAASLFSLFSFSPLFSQTIRFVDQNASGTGDGSSWHNAFPQLQQALAIAQNGDEIWVAKGIYKPTTTTDRSVFFNLSSGLKVYGGFSGTETLREQRDWASNPTILSGDIGVPGDSTDNSFNILYAYSPDEKTRLDGLVFEEGNATNPDPAIDFHRPTRSGGGIYLDGENFGYAQLSVANCIFRRNRATYQGGGIYANGREGGMAIVRLENCLFERNFSHNLGGAFSLENYFEQPFALEIKGCEFRGNTTLTSGNAVWLRAHQPVTFTDCKFSKNSSIGGGTVFFNQLENNHPVEFSGCSFDKNSNYTIYYSPNFQAFNDGNFTFKSCVFSENGLPVISISTAKIAQAKFENCIFSLNDNQIPFSSGFVITLGGTPDSGAVSFTNTLFYKNVGREIAVKSADISNCILIDTPSQGLNTNTVFWGSGPFKVSNTLFRALNCDSLGGNNNGPSVVICDSTNLLGLDPRFVNPAGSDFHLQPCSPAINAGNNAPTNAHGITTDLDGNPRIRNQVVDLGPYETNVSLNPTVLTAPACAGTSDGSVAFSPDICPPFNLVWNNGESTGTNTNGLAAGTYVFSTTGSNGIQVSDTLVIPEPAPIEVFYTLQNASCVGCSDGSIVFDSITGGINPLLPAPMLNLSPGNYSLTITDAAGCFEVIQFEIGVTIKTQETTLEYGLKLAPNPVASGGTTWLEWADQEIATVRILDLQGSILEEKQLAPNTSLQLSAHWPPGIYRVDLRSASGKRSSLQWVIL